MIGVFDSGIGGLSVLAPIVKAMPSADLVYFADTAHVPYGNKDDAFLRQRAYEIGHHLVNMGCKLIVVACNTATAAGVLALRETLSDIPVVGVEPGVKPAAAASKSGHIAVLTTTSTARSKRLSQLIRQYAGTVQVDVLPCPGWANMVEALNFNDPGFAEAARQHLAPILDAGADQIVLGCTHYSFLTPVLEPIVAGRATLVDVADAVARQCVRLAQSSSLGCGKLTLLASTKPEHLQAAFHRLGLNQFGERLTGPAKLSSI